MKQLMSNNQIALRPLEPTDLDTLYNWENDTALWMVSDTVAPYSRAALWQYLEGYTGDLYARSHTCMSPTAKKLIETFYDICSCVTHQDREGLRKLMPTVSKLLSQYRKLLLPDVIVDEWTDEKFRF